MGDLRLRTRPLTFYELEDNRHAKEYRKDLSDFWEQAKDLLEAFQDTWNRKMKAELPTAEEAQKIKEKQEEFLNIVKEINTTIKLVRPIIGDTPTNHKKDTPGEEPTEPAKFEPAKKRPRKQGSKAATGEQP